VRKEQRRKGGNMGEIKRDGNEGIEERELEMIEV
jgi:hypothetical protein